MPITKQITVEPLWTLWTRNFIDGQQAKIDAPELKLLCGVWEHCADTPMFALRSLNMVLHS